jgi:hypothetical protein
LKIWKQQFGKPWHIREDNIEIDLREIGLGGCGLHPNIPGYGPFAVIREYCNGSLPSIKGEKCLDWLAERLLASQEGLCSVNLIS